MTVVEPTVGTATTVTGADEPTPWARVRLRAGDRLAAAAGTAFVGMILAGNSMTESVVGADASPAGTVADLVAQGGASPGRGSCSRCWGCSALPRSRAGSPRWACAGRPRGRGPGGRSWLRSRAAWSSR